MDDFRKQPIAANHTNQVSPKRSRGVRRIFGGSSWSRNVALVVAVVAIILFIPVAYSYYSGGNEIGLVKSNEFQAVDVNSGGSGGDQLYFGHIVKLSNKFLELKNVFYIPNTSSSSSTSQSNLTLQPIVCQVDVPENEMVLARGSVTWWENLQNNGKISQSITNYQQSHGGQSCPSNS